MPGFGGRGRGQRGGGSGRGSGGGGGRGGGSGMGVSGDCVCVKCGYSVPKKPGTPCMQEKCPNCGTVLLREGGTHYSDAIKNKSS